MHNHMKGLKHYFNSFTTLHSYIRVSLSIKILHTKLFIKFLSFNFFFTTAVK